MATPKLSSLSFLFVLVLFLNVALFPHLSFSKPENEDVGTALTNKTDNQPSVFEFLRPLKGAHKGQKVKGIHQLKVYLSYFGYLNYHHTENHTKADADIFDAPLEAAVKAYQRFYHLKRTGKLDGPTISTMMKPRCGMPDVTTNHTMPTTASSRKHGFHSVVHFKFMDGTPRWGKNQLTYAFSSGFPTNGVPSITSAFDKWASATNNYFTFSMSEDISTADIKIGFRTGFHDDNSPFDGPHGVLAHSYSPPSGVLHFDGDESWSVGGVLPGYVDFESVALHEIGHILGLDHSQYASAVMYATFSYGIKKADLQPDDIQGIQTLYGV